MELASDITKVPFGRTYVLIGANDAPSPELSYGHGLKGTSFTGCSKGWLFNWLQQLGKKKQQQQKK